MFSLQLYLTIVSSHFHGNELPTELYFWNSQGSRNSIVPWSLFTGAKMSFPLVSPSILPENILFWLIYLETRKQHIAHHHCCCKHNTTLMWWFIWMICWSHLPILSMSRPFCNMIFKHKLFVKLKNVTVIISPWLIVDYNFKWHSDVQMQMAYGLFPSSKATVLKFYTGASWVATMISWGPAGYLTI